jgi:hypothetical protein
MYPIIQPRCAMIDTQDPELQRMADDLFRVYTQENGWDEAEAAMMLAAALTAELLERYLGVRHAA